MDEIIDSFENTSIHYGNNEYSELKKIYELTEIALKMNVYSAELLLQIKNKLVYYLQNIDLNTSQQHLFTYYSKEKVKSLKLEILNTEKIVTPYITSPCYLAVPHSINNDYLLKNKGEMKMWYTDD